MRLICGHLSEALVSAPTTTIKLSHFRQHRRHFYHGVVIGLLVVGSHRVTTQINQLLVLGLVSRHVARSIQAYVCLVAQQRRTLILSDVYIWADLVHASRIIVRSRIEVHVAICHLPLLSSLLERRIIQLNVAQWTALFALLILRHKPRAHTLLMEEMLAGWYLIDELSILINIHADGTVRVVFYLTTFIIVLFGV